MSDLRDMDLDASVEPPGGMVITRKLRCMTGRTWAAVIDKERGKREESTFEEPRVWRQDYVIFSSFRARPPGR
jgi:hypothetical protein